MHREASPGVLNLLPVRRRVNALSGLKLRRPGLRCLPVPVVLLFLNPLPVEAGTVVNRNGFFRTNEAEKRGEGTGQ
jgi:hypothetical protein